MTYDDGPPPLEVCKDEAQDAADATGRMWYVVESGRVFRVRDSDTFAAGKYMQGIIDWVAFPGNEHA